MYLIFKLQRESYEYWRQHFNSLDTPWTAEFISGWEWCHRPWLTLLAHLELLAEMVLVGGLIYLCVIYFH